MNAYWIGSICVAAVFTIVVTWHGLNSPKPHALKAAIFIIYLSLVVMVFLVFDAHVRVALGIGHQTGPSAEFRNGVRSLVRLLDMDRIIILMLGTSLFFLALLRRK